MDGVYGRSNYGVTMKNGSSGTIVFIEDPGGPSEGKNFSRPSDRRLALRQANWRDWGRANDRTQRQTLNLPPPRTVTCPPSRGPDPAASETAQSIAYTEDGSG
ncbi:hypothetical protein CIRG_01031 [Coccidioides immitis RMSCC 2394]|uniref:Uncharacterized protein n=1 Tax=Coccidioides immitis RMSCC 2394 TaxID=404692 RepID=A0A0J6XZQ9_COCIT|nr:hypothetical protein CIRG_01031 [Coccidioides immitis RMSCC 2394]